jgi:protoheme IX farnesyltransferase
MALASDFVELCKPRISIMVLLTVVAGGFLSAGVAASVLGLLNVAFGLFLIAASGSAWNQYLERYSDFLMPRTARRPLPDRRLKAGQVTLFGSITLGVGLAYLGTVVNVSAMLMGVATWLLYVCVYTPLKRLTWWNTAIGAVAGAMPVLVGAVGVGAPVGATAWALFVLLFLWQFPHFMAIAWLYRRDYAEGGLRMVTVVDPSGRLAGLHAVIVSVAMLFVSVGFALLFGSAMARLVIVGIGGISGLWYVWASIQFARNLDDASARRLLRISLICLPLAMLALVVARIVD